MPLPQQQSQQREGIPAPRSPVWPLKLPEEVCWHHGTAEPQGRRHTFHSAPSALDGDGSICFCSHSHHSSSAGASNISKHCTVSNGRSASDSIKHEYISCFTAGWSVCKASGGCTATQWDPLCCYQCMVNSLQNSCQLWSLTAQPSHSYQCTGNLINEKKTPQRYPNDSTGVPLSACWRKESPCVMLQKPAQLSPWHHCLHPQVLHSTQLLSAFTTCSLTSYF